MDGVAREAGGAECGPGSRSAERLEKTIPEGTAQRHGVVSEQRDAASALLSDGQAGV